MSLKITTKKEKAIWNEAVAATMKEVKKYDGIIPDEHEREVLEREVKKKMQYKVVGK